MYMMFLCMNTLVGSIPANC